jgi:hypothetical protein
LRGDAPNTYDSVPLSLFCAFLFGARLPAQIYTVGTVELMDSLDPATLQSLIDHIRSYDLPSSLILSQLTTQRHWLQFKAGAVQQIRAAVSLRRRPPQMAVFDRGAQSVVPPKATPVPSLLAVSGSACTHVTSQLTPHPLSVCSSVRLSTAV